MRVLTDGRDIGEARVVLRAEDDPRSESGWGGRMVNSDYVRWGLGGRRVQLRLPDGTEVACAVRSSGALVGLGPAPW